jgi:putative Mn2+ efflux pump MntP
MAQALAEAMSPAAGLVSRNHLDKRIAEFEARFSWKIIGLLGVQIVICSLITKYL